MSDKNNERDDFWGKSPDDEHGISREEFRRLKELFKNTSARKPEAGATEDEKKKFEAARRKELAEIYNLLLNPALYSELKTFLQKYATAPGVDVTSLLDRYLLTLTKWWYFAPEKIERFKELDDFLSYSRKALYFVFLAKLRENSETAPLEPEFAELLQGYIDDVKDLVDQDYFETLIERLKGICNDYQFALLTWRCVDELTFPQIAERVKETFGFEQTADQVRANFNKAKEKAFRVLFPYWFQDDAPASETPKGEEGKNDDKEADDDAKNDDPQDEK